MRKKIIKRYFNILLNCFMIMLLQSFSYATLLEIDDFDTYYFNIEYQYKDISGKICQIDPSDIISDELSKSSKIPEGTLVKIPEVKDIIKIKNNKEIFNKEVTERKICYNGDSSILDNILSSVDGTFEMPAANLEIEIILEDSDE